VFSGDESVRFARTSPRDKAFARVKDALQTLGDVCIGKSGAISIHPRYSLENFLTKTTFKGDVHDSGAEYVVTLAYDCTLSGIGWTILTLGIVCMFTGLLVLLVPMVKRTDVARAVEQALRDLA
jgi:hypothetical protein